MVKQTGPQTEKRLHSLAEASYINKASRNQSQPTYHSSQTRVHNKRKKIKEVSEPDLKLLITSSNKSDQDIYEQLKEDKTDGEHMSNDDSSYANSESEQDQQTTRL